MVFDENAPYHSSYCAVHMDLLRCTARPKHFHGTEDGIATQRQVRRMPSQVPNMPDVIHRRDLLGPLVTFLGGLDDILSPPTVPVPRSGQEKDMPRRLAFRYWQPFCRLGEALAFLQMQG